MALDSKDTANDDETTAKAIEATVKLATSALDGLELSDGELDALCDAALIEEGSCQIIGEDNDTAPAQLRGDIDSETTGSNLSADDEATRKAEDGIKTAARGHGES